MSSVMPDCVAPWSIACQASPPPQNPLSMGFSRQEYWSGLPFPSPEDLPYPGIKSTSRVSPALAGSAAAINYSHGLIVFLHFTLY